MNETDILNRKMKSNYRKSDNIEKSENIDLKITIKDLNSKCHIITINPLDKIRNIKEKLSNISGFDQSNHNFYFNGTIIHGDDELINLGLSHLCVVDMIGELKGGMTISVKTIDGKIFTFEVTASEKVANLKLKIYEKSGISPDKQKLVFKGSVLHSEDTMAEINVVSQSIVNMVILSGDSRPLAAASQPSGEDIQLSVRLTKTNVMKIRAHKNDKILEIKERIREQSDLNVTEQTLIFKSRILEETKTLNHYGIGDSDVIDLSSKRNTGFIIYFVIGLILIFVGLDFGKWFY